MLAVDSLRLLVNTTDATYIDERLQTGIRRVLELEFQGSNTGYALTCCKCQRRESSNEEPPVHVTVLVEEPGAPPVVRTVLGLKQGLTCQACTLNRSSRIEQAKGTTSAGPFSAAHVAARSIHTGAVHLLASHTSAADQTDGPATGVIGGRNRRATLGAAGSAPPAPLRGQTKEAGGSQGAGAQSSPTWQQPPPGFKGGQRMMPAGNGSEVRGYAELELVEHYEACSDKVYSNKAQSTSLQTVKTNVTFRRYYDASLVCTRADHGAAQAAQGAATTASRHSHLDSAEAAAALAAQCADQLSAADLERLRSLEFGVQDPWRRALAHVLAAVADWVLCPQSLDAACAAAAAADGAAAAVAAGPSSRGNNVNTQAPATPPPAEGGAATAPASLLLFRLQPWAFAVRENPDVQLYGSRVRPSSKCLGGRRLGKPPTSLLELVNAPPLHYSMARERLAADDAPPVWDPLYDGGHTGDAPPSAGRGRRQQQQQRMLARGGGKGLEEFRAGWTLPLQRLAALIKDHYKDDGPWKVSAKQLPGIMKDLFEGDVFYGHQQQQQRGQQPRSGAGGSGSGAGGGAAALPAVEAFLRDLGATHKQVIEMLALEEIDGNVGFCAECGYLGDLVACDTCVDSFCCGCIGCRNAADLPDEWQCKYCQGLFSLSSVAAAAGLPPSSGGAAAAAAAPSPAIPAVQRDPGAATAGAAAAAAQRKQEVGVQGVEAGAKQPGPAPGPSTAGAAAAAAAAAPPPPAARQASSDAAAAATSGPVGSSDFSGQSKRGRKQVQPRNKAEQPWRHGAAGTGLPPRAPGTEAAAAAADEGTGRPKRAAAIAAAKLLSPPAGGSMRPRRGGSAAGADESLSEEEVGGDSDAGADSEEARGAAAAGKAAQPAGKRAKRAPAAEDAAAGAVAKRRRPAEAVGPAARVGSARRRRIITEEDDQEAIEEGAKEESGGDAELARVQGKVPAAQHRQQQQPVAKGAAGGEGAAAAGRGGAEEEDDFRSAASGSSSDQGSPISDAAAAAAAPAAAAETAIAAAAAGGRGAAPAAGPAAAAGRPQRRAARGVAAAAAAAKRRAESSSLESEEEEEEDEEEGEEEEEEEESGDSDAAGQAGSKRRRKDADFKPSQESEDDEGQDEDESKSESAEEQEEKGSSRGERPDGRQGEVEEGARAKQPVASPNGRRATAAAVEETSSEGVSAPDSDDSEPQFVGEVPAPAGRGRGRRGGGGGRGGRGGRPPKARGRGGRGRGGVRAEPGGEEPTSEEDVEMLDDLASGGSDAEARHAAARPRGGSAAAGRGRGGGRRGGRPPRMASPRGRGGAGGSLSDDDAAAMLMLLNGRQRQDAAPAAGEATAAGDVDAAAAAGPSTAQPQPAGGAAAQPPPAAAAPAAAADDFEIRPNQERADGMGELVFSKAGALQAGLRLMELASSQRVRQGLVNAWLVAVQAALARYDEEGVPQNLSRVLRGLGLCFGSANATLQEKQDMLAAVTGILQQSLELPPPQEQ